MLRKKPFVEFSEEDWELWKEYQQALEKARKLEEKCRERGLE